MPDSQINSDRLTCHVCEGEGKVLANAAMDSTGPIDIIECTPCGGTGKVELALCDGCGEHPGAASDGASYCDRCWHGEQGLEVVRLRAENERLRERMRVMCREISERLDWVMRDRTEPDKVIANVSTTRSVMVRELSLSFDEMKAPPCSTCGGRGWHTAGGNDPGPCGCPAGEAWHGGFDV